MFLERIDQLKCIQMEGEDSPKERERYFDFQKKRGVRIFFLEGD